MNGRDVSFQNIDWSDESFFLGLPCFLDYCWNPAQSSQVKYLILHLIIVNSFFTLGLLIISSWKVLFAEIIVCPHLELKKKLEILNLLHYACK